MSSSAQQPTVFNPRPRRKTNNDEWTDLPCRRNRCSRNHRRTGRSSLEEHNTNTQISIFNRPAHSNASDAPGSSHNTDTLTTPTSTIPSTTAIVVVVVAVVVAGPLGLATRSRAIPRKLWLQLLGGLVWVPAHAVRAPTKTDKNNQPINQSTTTNQPIDRPTVQPVSYTHLTLPTIYSV